MLDLLASDTVELLRPWWSFDFDDILSLVVAVGAIVTAVRIKRSHSQVDTKTQEHVVTEQVDSSVLEQFLALSDRVNTLEGELATVQAELAEARRELAQALIELAEMQKVEEYLRASLHEKDKELADVRAAADRKQEEIERLRSRVAHLEDVCKRAGINGDEL